MDVARDKEQSFYQMKFDLAEAKRHRGGKCLEDLAQDAKKSGRKPATDVDPRPYYPMQLDAAKMQRMSEEERKKLIAAGKCFGCKQTGHLYRDCEERPKRKGKGKQKTLRVRPKPRAPTAEASATIEEVSSDSEEEGTQTSKKVDAPPAYSKKDLMAAIKKVSMEDCDDLLDSAALDFDQDLQIAQSHRPGCGQYVYTECTLN